MTDGILRPIDCDVHPGVPSTKVLLPYMSEYWQEQFVNRAIDNMELASYPPNAPFVCRQDWREKGKKPGSDFESFKRHALDGFGVEFAICNPLYGGQVSMSSLMAAAICSATNDWIKNEWLNKDERLRASIVIPAQAPELAVEEINRCASDKRFVQVMLLAANELLLGRQYYWPIYQAAAKHGLPIGIHAGSMYRYPTTPSGWPSHFLQDYASAPQIFAAQLHSLFAEGVFSQFPDLTFVFIESGVSWLPAYMWRASKTWRGVRGEIPWTKRPPIAEVRDRVRLTVQPLDVPGDVEKIERLIDYMGSEDMLLFSSDYPHWHFDGDDPMPPGIPQRLYRKIAYDNPVNTYLRLKERVS